MQVLEPKIERAFTDAIAVAVRSVLNENGAEILDYVFERAEKLRRIKAAIEVCNDRRKLRSLYRIEGMIRSGKTKVGKDHRAIGGTVRGTT